MKRWISGALLIGAALVFLSMGNKTSMPVSPLSDSFMDDISIVQVDADSVEWTATIGRAVMVYGNTAAELSEIEFVFPQQRIAVRADEGTFDLMRSDLLIRGAVRGRQDGVLIHTDSVRWDAGSRSLGSDSPVLVTGKAFTVRGTGLNVDAQGKVSVRRDVHAFISIP